MELTLSKSSIDRGTIFTSFYDEKFAAFIGKLDSEIKLTGISVDTVTGQITCYGYTRPPEVICVISKPKEES